MEIISNKMVKIRKNHICKGCGQTLHRGAFSHTWQCMNGPAYFGVYWCPTCTKELKYLSPDKHIELQEKIIVERYNPNFRALIDSFTF